MKYEVHTFRMFGIDQVIHVEAESVVQAEEMAREQAMAAQRQEMADSTINPDTVKPAGIKILKTYDEQQALLACNPGQLAVRKSEAQHTPKPSNGGPDNPYQGANVGAD